MVIADAGVAEPVAIHQTAGTPLCGIGACCSAVPDSGETGDDIGHVGGLRAESNNVGPEALGLTTLVGLVTIATSTYMILYSHPLYQKLAPFLGWFERRNPFREQAVETDSHSDNAPEVIIFGLGRYGGRLAMQLQDADIRVLGIDFDPERVIAMRERGIAVHYGDGQESGFLEELPLNSAKWVVSTLPDVESNVAFLNALKERRFRGEVAFVARDDEHGLRLKQAGAPTVLYPMRDLFDLNAVDSAASAIIAARRFALRWLAVRHHRRCTSGHADGGAGRGLHHLGQGGQHPLPQAGLHHAVCRFPGDAGRDGGHSRGIGQTA